MRRHLPAALLFALAVAVRLPNVWAQPLSQDEVFSARIVGEPTIGRALHHVVRTESTPPLWYSVGWAIHHLGVPTVDIRLLSVLYGGIAAVLAYLLARTVLPVAASAAAGGLVAVGYQPVVHGAELRSYEQLLVLSAALAYLLVRELREPSRRLELTLGATVCAGLLTHYFFVFTVAAAVVWLWAEPRARAVRRRVSIAFAGGALAAAPWLPGFLVQLRHDHYWWIGPFKARTVAVTPLHLLVPLGNHHLELGLSVVAIVLAGTVVLGRHSAEGRLYGLLALVPIVLAATAWAAGSRSYAIRNLIEVTPFVAIAAVGAVSALPRRAVAGVAAVGVATVALVSVTQTTIPAPPYDRLAHLLVREGWRPSDPIAVFGNFYDYRAPLEWYLPHAPLLDVSHATKGCPALFAIVGHRLAVPRRDVGAARRLGRFTVVRLRGVRNLAGATLLATRDASSRCVRLSTNPRLEPLA